MFDVTMQSVVIVDGSDDDLHEITISKLCIHWAAEDVITLLTALITHGRYETAEPEHGIWFSVTVAAQS